MRKEDCFYLGKIVSKYSYKGEVLVKIETDEPEIYENMESVLIAMKGGNLVPFFIDRCRLHKSLLLRIDFEEVKDEAAADRLMNHQLFLPLSMLPKLEGDKFYFHEITGFSVEDTQLGNIGTITGVNDTTSQAIFEVEKDGKEVLIPITDEIFIGLDRSKKIVKVSTPDGLVDLYMS